MKPVAVAARAKGRLNLVRRAGAIGRRYGLGPGRMERRLADVTKLTERYSCSATLPVTAVAVERNPRVIDRYVDLGIEFAAHGYRHVDHATLSTAEQIEQIGRARRALEAHGIPTDGFRAPYLRWNGGTLLALREHGFRYDSSQAMHWSIDPRIETEAYRRVLSFYDALSAAEHPVLPRLEDGLVRIPCCLPDDESAIDRLRVNSPTAIAELWTSVLRRTVERDELFTLQVHPERIRACVRGVASVLDAAHASRPQVWIAQLGEIARWWRERAASTVSIDEDHGRYRVRVTGPGRLAFLVHNLEVPKARTWGDDVVVVPEDELTVRAARRPFVAVHPASAPALRAFLREQGYIVEAASSGQAHAHFLRREVFARGDELPLLTELGVIRAPLLRLARWPDGARGAVAVTGDIDALTMWDYGLRLLGR